MNPVAIKTAAKTGFPVDHIIGNIWSNAEEDVRPAGRQACVPARRDDCEYWTYSREEQRSGGPGSSAQP
jgi:hypothetical protein